MMQIPNFIPGPEQTGFLVNPQVFKNSLTKAALENQFLQLQNQYYGPHTQATIDLLKQQAGHIPFENKLIEAQVGRMPFENALTSAQTAHQNLLTKYPLLGMTDTAGQIGALQWLEAQGGNANKPPQQNQPQQQNAFNNITGQSPINNELLTGIKNIPNGNLNSLVKFPSGNVPGLPTPPQPSENSLAKALRDSINGNLTSKKASSTYLMQKSQAYPWTNMPADMKKFNLAQARGLGYDYDEASKLFNNGYTLGDMAKQKGIDANNMPSPIWPPTNTNLTNYQRSNVALSALNKIGPIISSAIEPYASRFNGYSLEQTIDALKGTNIDKQAKYLAASAMQPELAALRTKAQGGQVGITAIEEMIHKSQNNIKIYQPLLSGQVYNKMNQYVDKWINQLNSAERKGLLNFQSLSDEQQIENQEISSLSDEELAKIVGGG